MKVVTFFDLDVVRRRRIGDWSGGETVDVGLV